MSKELETLDKFFGDFLGQKIGTAADELNYYWKEFRAQAEHSQPKISDVIVEQIQAFKYSHCLALNYEEVERRGCYTSKREWVEEKLKQNLPIHRVKTNEGDWSVGDEACYTYYKEEKFSEPFIITKFEIDGINIVAYSGDGCKQTDIPFLRKPTLSDVTPPVITHDGVEVRDDDEVYWIDTQITICEGNVFKSQLKTVFYKEDNIKVFSTKEKAREYIRLNKVRHSDKDVMHHGIKFANWLRDNYSTNIRQGSDVANPYYKWRKDFTTEIYTVEELYKVFTELNNKTND